MILEPRSVNDPLSLTVLCPCCTIISLMPIVLILHSHARMPRNAIVYPLPIFSQFPIVPVHNACSAAVVFVSTACAASVAVESREAAAVDVAVATAFDGTAMDDPE